MSSPTKLSLALLRRVGGLAEVTERWNPHAKVRHDLLGFIDVLGVMPGESGCLAVQTTSASHQAERITKIAGIAAAQTWLAAGNRIEVHGWRKKAGRWEVTVTLVTLSAGSGKTEETKNVETKKM